MLNITLLFNENLLTAEQNLIRANSENLVELCEKYLLLLNEYRDELYKLRGAPEINLRQSSNLARELSEEMRKAIRSTVEITTREHNQTEALLKSLTAISGYEAVETFNRLKYKDSAGWELKANLIRVENDSGERQMTIQEAVNTASRLRREAYIENKITFLE